MMQLYHLLMIATDSTMEITEYSTSNMADIMYYLYLF